ncbi:MAG: hypothetical protein ACE5FR_01105 [Rhodospirillales bacterium]
MSVSRRNAIGCPGSSKQEPPEKRDHGENDRGEQGRSGPRIFSRSGIPGVHGSVRASSRFPQVLTEDISAFIVSIMKSSKKRIVDIVIFTGMAVNAVVIVLILYYFVF